MVGDFVLQTDWQARHKHGGLGSDPIARRALVAHVLLYTAAFVPALVWLADSLGVGIVGVAALIAIPHLVQDDGRLLGVYLRSIKRSDAKSGGFVALAVDQSLHVVTLFAIALIAAS
jgi:type IV secretory pathway TrbD component